MNGWILIAMLASLGVVEGAVGAAAVDSDAPVVIEPGEQRTLSLAFEPRQSPSDEVLLWVCGRLMLDQGEAWGEHALSLEVNGKPVTAAHGPLNRLPYLIDEAYSPRTRTDLFDPASGRWFLRYDSDFVPYNSLEPGDPYHRTDFLRWANHTRAFREAHYLYVFAVGDLVPPGESEARVRVANASSDWPMTLTLEAARHRGDRLWFQAEPGLMVFPWAFPRARELLSPGQALRAEAFAGQFKPVVLSVRNPGLAVSFEVEVDDLHTASQPAVALRVQVRPLEHRPHERPRPTEFRGLPGAVPYPDLLSSSNRWELEAASTGSLWLIVHMPAGTPPGDYQGTVHLAGSDGRSEQVPLQVRVLPGTLAASDITFGVWDNKLPGAHDELTRQRLQDLQQHGINTLTTDPWTSPVRIAWEGGQLTIDASRVRRTLELYREHGLNQRPFPYGMVTRLFGRAEQVAAGENVSLSADQIMRQVLVEILRISDELGMPLYFHTVDEPDVHPKAVPTFEQLCQLIRSVPGAKVWSNNTASGMQHFAELIDLNVAQTGDVQRAWLGQPTTNFFFPDWQPAEPAWVRQHVRQVYSQARSITPDANRRMYGLFAWYTQMEGVWSFAYHWNESWYVAWPFPGEDGRLQSTIGWEMLRVGIDDYRQLRTLEHLLADRFGPEQSRSRIQALWPPFDQLAHLSSAEIEQVMHEVARQIAQLSEEAEGGS